jgi:hypothetical protein
MKQEGMFTKESKQTLNPGREVEQLCTILKTNTYLCAFT